MIGSLAAIDKGAVAKLLSISGADGDLRKTPSILDSPLVKHFEVVGNSFGGMVAQALAF